MAFDRIDRTALIQSLRRLGLPKTYLDAVSSLYDGPTFVVKNGTAPEATGSCQAGIRQGCPLSPYLFVLVMTSIMHDVDEQIDTDHTAKNTWSTINTCYDLEYADDTPING